MRLFNAVSHDTLLNLLRLYAFICFGGVALTVLWKEGGI